MLRIRRAEGYYGLRLPQCAAACAAAREVCDTDDRTRMGGPFRILPSSALARTAKSCPLLENQSDREAWVACCTQRFLPLAKRLGGGDTLAEDILQESWIRVLEHICAYRGDSPACSWIRAIVLNCARDFYRERQRVVGQPRANVADPAPDPEELAQQQQMLFLLREIVATLPAVYRDVLNLRYSEGLSTAETARILDISRSNVSTRLTRAVKMIVRRLDARARRR